MDDVLTAKQVAQLIQTTEASLAQDRYRGTGLPYTKINSRVRYLREDVVAYLNANRVGGAA
ncbi:helix-turn-helix domain-containing protein [Mycolicibacterium mengxianglii]|uniref:helix-turn-helix domain-containing protein n=1 Tax=Mycolicibacterium mengxianglii TaxID=2736649 RepID=UPI0018D121FF|nr:helix-turn-helix domain-containing protein [Mycolicibacterium mengxianglii]